MTDPWQCPSCRVWMAPGITEHRCEGNGGVSADAPTPPTLPAGWSASATTTPTGTWVIYTWPSTTATVNVHGSVISERDLADAVLRELNRKQRRNPTNFGR